MMTKKSNIELIVRGGQWGVQLDVKEFPIICPSCNKYFKDLYVHNHSRYGQVGSIECKCGETVHLTDSDNIVEYIKCHSQDKSINIDFKDLFHLQAEDFKSLNDHLKYDIFELHLNDRLQLAQLVKEIEQKTGVIATLIDSDIPLPEDVKKWIGLIKNESTTKPNLH